MHKIGLTLVTGLLAIIAAPSAHAATGAPSPSVAEGQIQQPVSAAKLGGTVAHHRHGHLRGLSHRGGFRKSLKARDSKALRKHKRLRGHRGYGRFRHHSLRHHHGIRKFGHRGFRRW